MFNARDTDLPIAFVCRLRTMRRFCDGLIPQETIGDILEVAR